MSKANRDYHQEHLRFFVPFVAIPLGQEMKRWDRYPLERSSAVRSDSTQFQHHWRDLSRLKSGAVIEFFDKCLCDFFPSLALSIQVAQTFPNASHLVSMLQELLLREDGTMSADQEIEIHLCDLV